MKINSKDFRVHLEDILEGETLEGRVSPPVCRSVVDGDSLG